MIPHVIWDAPIEDVMIALAWFMGIGLVLTLIAVGIQALVRRYKGD